MKVSRLEETLMAHLRVNDISGWEREFRFHPTRKWRFDFAFPEIKLAVECEGGLAGGRHCMVGGYLGDIDKYNEAEILRWHVLRFAWPHIRTGQAIESVKRFLQSSSGSSTF